MSSLLDSIRSQLSQEQIQTLSRELGADEQATSQAIDATLPVILGGLEKTASSPDGAAKLHQALSGGGDVAAMLGALGGGGGASGGGIGDMLGGLTSMLGGGKPAAGGGGGVGDLLGMAMGGKSAGGGKDPMTDLMGMMLGGGKQRVEQGLGKATGFDGAMISKLLAFLGPMVLGGMAKQTAQNKIGPGDLSGMLKKERAELEQRSPQSASMLGKLFDQDGDGDFDLSDALKVGADLFFKKK